MDGQLGVLAFGDSITNGGGEIQWGVALQSWALWTARGLGVPYSPHAVDGATAEHVLLVQIPRYLATVADPQARYQLGCLYVGTNDLRLPDFEADEFEARLGEAAEFLSGRCERVLMPTIPLDMGRPRSVPRVLCANEVIERVAARIGGLLLDLSAFRGRDVMMADHVHPTAFGQITIAERALDLLAADGMEVRIRPWTLVSYRRPPLRRLQSAWTYGYRFVKEWWRVSRG